ncbi:hypothetical protein TI39_contig4305g00004 [Zymoseptoria brevis]|uniref:Uncharacterized protein n=1 Tax=Zymoseptoria brevis TaxID=1047168 RepID=A0A0F4G848_9PEZI|nr:hypothetical protein TI39_contig4305g00004 [Zymoseptoria brevis]
MERFSYGFRFLYYGMEHYPGPESGTRESEAPSIHAAPTERELASVSYASEYAWKDKQAAALMIPLNQSLQLVVAQISIEQAERSTKQTAAAHELAQKSYELPNIMARDSAIGIKSGERSTQLTLLAAIYLPLTLATGVFGMQNIAQRLDLRLALAYRSHFSRRDKRLEQQTDQDDQDEKASRSSLHSSGHRTFISTTSLAHRRLSNELSERSIQLRSRTSGQERVTGRGI